MPEKRSITETATEARQGVTGHNARIVLLVSCALAVIGLGFAFFLVGP